MRIVLLAETFTPKMGYSENMLSKYLARLGADVHLVANDLRPYYQLPEYGQIYSTFHDDPPKANTVEKIDGFTVHLLSHIRVLGYVRMRGLFSKLLRLRPDVVQCSAAIGWIPLDAALMKPRFGYKLFTANHTHASVFPLATQDTPWWNREKIRCLLTRAIPGRLVSIQTERCYSISEDCAAVATRFFGVQRSKSTVCELGVDPERFRPIRREAGAAERAQLRSRFGWTDDDIVCIYSGRLTEDKNPLLLAAAIGRMFRPEQHGYRGLFVGAGPQADRISRQAGCMVVPFVPVEQLGEYFRSADIGVWPTQESLSMIEAAACGIPIVINHTVSTRERIDGNGLTYLLGDVEDLTRVLRQLGDRDLRQTMGECGARRMREEFSWEKIAKRRLDQYRFALDGR